MTITTTTKGDSSTAIAQILVSWPNLQFVNALAFLNCSVDFKLGITFVLWRHFSPFSMQRMKILVKKLFSNFKECWMLVGTTPVFLEKPSNPRNSILVNQMYFKMMTKQIYIFYKLHVFSKKTIIRFDAQMQISFIVIISFLYEIQVWKTQWKCFIY